MPGNVAPPDRVKSSVPDRDERGPSEEFFFVFLRIASSEKVSMSGPVALGRAQRRTSSDGTAPEREMDEREIPPVR